LTAELCWKVPIEKQDYFDGFGTKRWETYKLRLKIYSWNSPRMSEDRSRFRASLSKFAFECPSPLGKRKATDPCPPRNLKRARGYAPPDKYAHLSPLTDHLAPGLDGASCPYTQITSNPISFKSSSVESSQLATCLSYDTLTEHWYIVRAASAQTGHHFANPMNSGNVFANQACRPQILPTRVILILAGFTPTLLPPSDGYSLPKMCNIGLVSSIFMSSPSSSPL